MADDAQGIDQDTLQALVESGSAREFLARRTADGAAWTFNVRLGVNWLPVRPRREPLRKWASLPSQDPQGEAIAMKFPVVLHKDPDSDFGVTVPDVPGCFSAGSTMDQALDNVREALELHFEGLVADGEPLPKAQAVDAHLANPAYAGGVWALVDFDVTPYLGKAVRFNATLPEHLLARIDAYVKHHPGQKSRSGFLAEAALKMLQQG